MPFRVLGHFDRFPDSAHSQMLDEMTVRQQGDALLLEFRLNGSPHVATSLTLDQISGVVSEDDVWVGDLGGDPGNEIVITDQAHHHIVFTDRNSSSLAWRQHSVPRGHPVQLPGGSDSPPTPESLIEQMLKEGPTYHHIQHLGEFLAFSCRDETGSYRSSSSSVPKMTEGGFAYFTTALMEGLQSPGVHLLQKVLMIAEYDRLLALTTPGTGRARPDFGGSELRRRHAQEISADATLGEISSRLHVDRSIAGRITEEDLAEIASAAESEPITGREHFSQFVDYACQYGFDPYRSPQAPHRPLMLEAEKKAAGIIKDQALLVELPQVFEPSRGSATVSLARVSRDPWHYLTGTCGHTALSMVKAARTGGSGGAGDVRVEGSQKTSLEWAREHQLTMTGEIFDLANLARLAHQFFGLEGVIHQEFLLPPPPTYAETYQRDGARKDAEYAKALLAIQSGLDRGNPVMLAFDADIRGNPTKLLGLRSHFAVIVHHFGVDGETFFIARHGWGEQGVESKASPDLQYDPDLKGYHIVCARELVASMLGLTSSDYYRPLAGNLVSGKSIPKHQTLAPAASKLFAPVDGSDLNAGADQSRIRGVVEFSFRAPPSRGTPFSAYTLA